MESLKKNLALVLAFLLPIVLIVVVALFAYLPSLFFSPRYNFVYAVCGDSREYNYGDYSDCQSYLIQKYKVEEGKLVVRPDGEIDTRVDLNRDGKLDEKSITYGARIFLYDTKKDENREITVEEAERLKLNGLLTSPDGVSISGDYNNTGGGDFFFFFDGGYSSYGYYLVKGNSRKKVNLIGERDPYSYNNNFRILGWVLPELPE